MEDSKTKIKYFIYARKSTEDDNKQVQSIDDQIDRLKKLANELDLKIIKVFIEAKSAKKPHNRPEFEKMIDQLLAGEADGILCWKLDRLSRNPVDSGTLQWLLQQDVIKAIRTIERFYLPGDNALIFSVEAGGANQFILDLSKNVKRGLESKVKKGLAPIIAPVGYLNSKFKERGENTIELDPERFDLVRKMFDLMLTASYSVPQILKIANENWGFKTRKSKKLGGTELSRSVVYKIFTSIFYTGNFEYKGTVYKGNHKPMITLDEYDRIQKLLGRKGKPRPKTHAFAFTGVIRCGDPKCSCLITAEEKTKFIKSTGQLKHYIYYRCTKKKKDVNCTQKGVISVEELEKQIELEISKVNIVSQLGAIALKVLRENNDKETHTRTNIQEMQMKAFQDTQKQIDRLLDMKLREQITDEEYNSKRDLLLKEKQQLKQKLDETDNRADKWLKLTEDTFNFALYAHNEFLKGDLHKKKEILMTLGSNFLLKDRKLTLASHKWLKRIENEYPPIEDKYKGLELDKINENELSSEQKEGLEIITEELRAL
ncbi:MAG: recombinase family protein [Candidatus Melainabacteria bacterium]|nr:recombinase family protein [Candidatus Melainabacteria bacterium]